MGGHCREPLDPIPALPTRPAACKGGCGALDRQRLVVALLHNKGIRRK